MKTNCEKRESSRLYHKNTKTKSIPKSTRISKVSKKIIKSIISQMVTDIKAKKWIISPTVGGYSGGQMVSSTVENFSMENTMESGLIAGQQEWNITGSSRKVRSKD